MLKSSVLDNMSLEFQVLGSSILPSPVAAQAYSADADKNTSFLASFIPVFLWITVLARVRQDCLSHWSQPAGHNPFGKSNDPFTGGT